MMELVRPPQDPPSATENAEGNCLHEAVMSGDLALVRWLAKDLGVNVCCLDVRSLCVGALCRPCPGVTVLWLMSSSERLQADPLPARLQARQPGHGQSDVGQRQTRHQPP